MSGEISHRDRMQTMSKLLIEAILMPFINRPDPFELAEVMVSFELAVISLITTTADCYHLPQREVAELFDMALMRAHERVGALTAAQRDAAP